MDKPDEGISYQDHLAERTAAFENTRRVSSSASLTAILKSIQDLKSDQNSANQNIDALNTQVQGVQSDVVQIKDALHTILDLLKSRSDPQASKPLVPSESQSHMNVARSTLPRSKTRLYLNLSGAFYGGDYCFEIEIADDKHPEAAAFLRNLDLTSVKSYLLWNPRFDRTPASSTTTQSFLSLDLIFGQEAPWFRSLNRPLLTLAEVRRRQSSYEEARNWDNIVILCKHLMCPNMLYLRLFTNTEYLYHNEDGFWEDGVVIGRVVNMNSPTFAGELQRIQLGQGGQTLSRCPLQWKSS